MFGVEVEGTDVEVEREEGPEAVGGSEEKEGSGIEDGEFDVEVDGALGGPEEAGEDPEGCEVIGTDGPGSGVGPVGEIRPGAGVALEEGEEFGLA